MNFSDTTQVFLQPTTGSKGDAKIGILNAAPKSALRRLNHAIRAQVEELVGDQDLYLWAIEDGLRNRPYWERMQRGDLVLFDIRPGRIERAAKIVGTMDHHQLTEAAWGTEKFTQKYPLVYFFEAPFDPGISLDEFNNLTGYGDRKMAQNFRRLAPEKAYALLELIEHPIFEPLISKDPDKGAESWHLTRRGTQATATFTDEGLVVHQGSRCSEDLTKGAVSAPFAKRREKMIADGTIKNSALGLVFSEDYQFKSPSGAASVIMGAHANGWIEWKNAEGKTLKEVKREE